MKHDVTAMAVNDTDVFIGGFGFCLYLIGAISPDVEEANAVGAVFSSGSMVTRPFKEAVVLDDLFLQ